MRTSLSTTFTVRPLLEHLEIRDLPSTLGAVLPFVTDRLIVEKSLKNSNTCTSNLQTDFNALQSDIVHLGPNNPTTLADLARTMSDYGFAEQTYDLADNTVELFKAGIVFGIANGFFDESDVVPIFFSLRDVQRLQNITNSQANTAKAIAQTAFANDVSIGGQFTIAGLSRAAHIP